MGLSDLSQNAAEVARYREALFGCATPMTTPANSGPLVTPITTARARRPETTNGRTVPAALRTTPSNLEAPNNPTQEESTEVSPEQWEGASPPVGRKSESFHCILRGAEFFPYCVQ